MNFVPELFLKKMTKFMCKKEFFQSSGTKNERNAKFRDENNSLAKIKYNNKLTCE